MSPETKDILEVIFWSISVLILFGTIYAIYYGPIKAVKMGRDLDNEFNKRDTKMDLFLTLFSLRGSPIHVEFVNSLNQIDIVFQGDSEVLAAWHRYYQALHQSHTVNAEEVWALHRVELLSRMANSLGYQDVSQTDIMRHYYPQGHLNALNDRYEFREAQMNYYQVATALYEIWYQQATIGKPHNPEERN